MKTYNLTMTKKKKSLLFFICYMALQLGFGSIVLKPSSQSSLPDYFEFLKKNKNFYISWVQAWSLQNKSNLKTLKLERNFRAAEEHFIVGEIQKAQKIYISIVQSQHSHDWPQAQHQKIFESFFRLAQIEPHHHNFWIEKAFNFHPGAQILNPKIPQSFRDKWEEIKSKKTTLLISPTPGYKVYVNGLKLPQKLEPLSPYRVTWVSEKSRAFTKTLNGSHIPSFSPPLLFHATGNCKKPKGKDKGSAQIFFSSICVSQINDLKRIYSSKNKPFTSFKKEAQDKAYKLAHYSFNDGLVIQELDPKKSFWSKKSSWIYIASGLMASYGIYFLVQRNSEPNDNSYSPPAVLNF